MVNYYVSVHTKFVSMQNYTKNIPSFIPAAKHLTYSFNSSLQSSISENQILRLKLF